MEIARHEAADRHNRHYLSRAPDYARNCFTACLLACLLSSRLLETRGSAIAEKASRICVGVGVHIRDWFRASPRLRPGLLPELPLGLGSIQTRTGPGLRSELRSGLQPGLLLVHRYLAFSADFLPSGILALTMQTAFAFEW